MFAFGPDETAEGTGYVNVDASSKPGAAVGSGCTNGQPFAYLESVRG